MVVVVKVLKALSGLRELDKQRLTQEDQGARSLSAPTLAAVLIHL